MDVLSSRSEFLAATDLLIYSIFNASFNTNYVASVWEVLLNIYFIADPRNKARVYQFLFTYSQTIATS